MLPAHGPGLQGSDPVFDILVIVSSSLSGSLAQGQAAEGRNLEQGQALPFPALATGEGPKQEEQGGSFSLPLGGHSPPCTRIPDLLPAWTWGSPRERMPRWGGGSAKARRKPAAPCGGRYAALTHPALHKQAQRVPNPSPGVHAGSTGNSSTLALLWGWCFLVLPAFNLS